MTIQLEKEPDNPKIPLLNCFQHEWGL
jgi:hypothetical protein